MTVLCLIMLQASSHARVQPNAANGRGLLPSNELPVLKDPYRLPLVVDGQQR